jgi:hypothetical protein
MERGNFAGLRAFCEEPPVVGGREDLHQGLGLRIRAARTEVPTSQQGESRL